MNCTEARTHLPALLYGDLPSAEAAAVEGHLSACPACQRERAALEQVRQALDAVPAPAVQVDLPRLYREAADRQARQARRWRRVAVALVGVAAALLLAALLRLEVRMEAHQVVVRWGAAPAEEPVPPPQVVVERVEVRTSPEVEERLRVMNELLHALAAEADGRDAQRQQDVARLRARLDELEVRTSLRWRDTERSVAALYVLTRKGD